MLRKPSNKQLRQEAVDIVRRTRRPEGMSRTTFASVKKLMFAIARQYPVANPSVGYLGKEIDRSERQTRRLLRITETTGLIVTEHDAGWASGKPGKRGISPTCRYHLAALVPDQESVSPPDISCEEMSDTSTPTEYYSTSFRSTPPGVLPSVGLANSTFRTPPEPERQLEADGPEPEPAAPPRTASDIVREGDSGRRGTPRRNKQSKPKPNAPQRLTEHFLHGWQELQAAREYLAPHKPWISRKMAMGYLTTTFLKPESGPAYTEAQVEEIIDQFFDDLSRYQFQLKPDQAAFFAFTARWKPPSKSAMVPNSTPNPTEEVPLHERNLYRGHGKRLRKNPPSA